MSGPLLKRFAIRAAELRDEMKALALEPTAEDFLSAFEDEVDKFLEASTPRRAPPRITHRETNFADRPRPRWPSFIGLSKIICFWAVYFLNFGCIQSGTSRQAREGVFGQSKM